MTTTTTRTVICRTCGQRFPDNRVHLCPKTETGRRALAPDRRQRLAWGALVVVALVALVGVPAFLVWRHVEAGGEPDWRTMALMLLLLSLLQTLEGRTREIVRGVIAGVCGVCGIAMAALDPDGAWWQLPLGLALCGVGVWVVLPSKKGGAA